MDQKQLKISMEVTVLIPNGNYFLFPGAAGVVLAAAAAAPCKRPAAPRKSAAWVEFPPAWCRSAAVPIRCAASFKFWGLLFLSMMDFVCPFFEYELIGFRMYVMSALLLPFLEHP
jgi:hypothetical protein